MPHSKNAGIGFGVHYALRLVWIRLYEVSDHHAWLDQQAAERVESAICRRGLTRAYFVISPKVRGHRTCESNRAPFNTDRNFAGKE
jgi:hypothetical protein